MNQSKNQLKVKTRKSTKEKTNLMKTRALFWLFVVRYFCGLTIYIGRLFGEVVDLLGGGDSLGQGFRFVFWI